MLLIVPILFSYYLSLKVNMKESTRLEVLIVQPNIDPYTDKFNVGFKEQLEDFITLAKTKLTEEIQLLVGPETALLEGVWENRIEATYSIRKFRELQKEFPNLNILVGASTYKMFVHGEEKTATAREIRNENTFYDAYNSAIFIPVSGEVKVYHKTKLVPGVEKMPYPNVLDKFAALAVDLGGISGSLGNKNEINTFNVDGVGYATASAAGITEGSIPLTGASINKKSKFNYFVFHLSNPFMTFARDLTMRHLVKNKKFIDSYLGKIYKN